MADKQKRLVQIDPGRMQLAQYQRQEWVANAPEGCTVDDIQKPEFWALMAFQLKPYDRIEVRADDGTWIADLVVIGCDRLWAKVAVLGHHKLTAVDEAMKGTTGYRIEFKGPQKKWCVIRNSDDNIVREGIGSKDDAFAQAKEFERNTASAA